MMFSLPKNPFVRGLVLCLVIMLLFVPSVAQVQAGSNPFGTLLVGVLFGFVGLVVYDLMSCQLNVLFGGCGGGGGSKGSPLQSSKSKSSSVNKNSTGTSNVNGPQGSIVQQPCQTEELNACGMPGTGFIVNGVCNATPPPNSACPIPVILSTGFYANPSRVREGGTTKLYWDVNNATVCTLTGGGLSLSSLGIADNHDTNPITQKTVFKLSCQNGVDGPSANAQATVNLIPSYQEI